MSNSFGRAYDELEVGKYYMHEPAKTITESDNNLFCLLTLNRHPVHSDVEYAEKSFHKQVLVAGTYVISLVVGMSVRDISGKAIANLMYSEIKHNAPVFIGDTLSAESKILSKRVSNSNPKNGIVEICTKAYNQHRTLVLVLIRKILVPK